MTERVEDEDALLRRVPDKPDLWKRQKDGTVRPSSVAFKPHSADAGVSVDVRRLLADPRRPPEPAGGAGLAEVTAGVVRELELDVEHDPIPENAAHANIIGMGPLPPAQAKRLQQALAMRCAWVQMPASAMP